jgi:hypothetical protein
VVFRRAELVVVAVAVAVVIALAITDPGSDRQKAERHDVEVVRRAAVRLDYATVADAWRQARLGTGAALGAITEGVDVRHLATHQEGDAIVLTFQSRSGVCIDLVSRPEANTVESRDC